MMPQSRAEPRVLSTAIRASTRSSSDSALDVRLTARKLRSVVNRPTMTGSRSDCATNCGTSRALITTTSTWPPAKAENWSKGLLASIRMLRAASHSATAPESSSHSQTGSGASASRMRAGSDCWLPGSGAGVSAGGATTVSLPPQDAAISAAAARSAPRARGATRLAIGSPLRYPALEPTVLAAGARP